MADDNKAAVSTLNNLIETCKDGEYGFRACAEQSQAESLKTLFGDRAAEEIIEAAVARRPRLLIGNDARALDALARLLPARYWSFMGRGMALAAKRQ